MNLRKITKIGVLTSGGDCAGLNAAIRAITFRAINGFGWEVVDGAAVVVEARNVVELRDDLGVAPRARDGERRPAALVRLVVSATVQ